VILRVCVVIPVFANHRELSEVVKEVVLRTPFPVLIVDGGADVPVSDCLYSWEVRQALEQGRVRVARFERRCFKGALMSFAFGELVAQGYTHACVMEGDGQHFGREIVQLVGAAKEFPGDLIIGDRGLPREAPESALRQWCKRWVGYETGLHIRDARSGFRLYPLQRVQDMRFSGRGADFEVETLVRLLWKGVPVREIAVEARTPQKDETTRWWARLQESVRESVLSLLLVGLSLLRQHGSPLELANALALGVFIGCTPFYGAHTLLAAGAALLFHLNFIAVWLGSHVSTPLLAPFLISGEVYVGRSWLHAGDDQTWRGEFLQWLAGAGVVGLILGLATWVIALSAAAFVRRARRREPRPQRTPGDGWMPRALAFVVRRLGSRCGYFCLYIMVPIFYFFYPRAWRGLTEYWMVMEPREGWWSRQRRIWRHYSDYARILLERVIEEAGADARPLARSTGEGQITAANAEASTGVVAFSAHWGAGDLAFQVFDQAAAGRPRGEWMVDRPSSLHLELVPFLGRLAAFDVGPFAAAATSQAPVVFVFCARGVNGQYEFHSDFPRLFVYDESEPRELQLWNWLREFVAELERHVCMSPEQWFNFYPFWSASPVAGVQGHVLEELRSIQALKPIAEARASRGPELSH
jgi:predicted LPLAT superfamily acyltransferase/uncharacterized protein (DUF2062 family)